MTTFFVISLISLFVNFCFVLLVVFKRKVIAAVWNRAWALYTANHEQKVAYYNYQTLAYLAIAPQDKTLEENIEYYKKWFIPKNYWFCIEIEEVENKVCNIQKSS